MKWYAEGNTGVIKFYGEIYQWWNGADDFTTTFDELQQKFSEIKIRVHCYGGSVIEGNVIQHAIATSKVPVHVVIEGVAASMGSIFILPAKKISMAANSYMMIHEPTTYLFGNSKQLFEQGNLLKKMTKNAVADYAKRSGKPAAKFEAMMDGVDHWLTADEAKELGLIDEVIESIGNVEDVTKGQLEVKDDFKNYFDRYAASLVDKTTIPNFKHKNFEMKKILIETFSLTGVNEDSSDTAIVTAMKVKFDNQLSAIEALQKSGIDAAIASAEKASGRTFSDAEKTIFKGVGEKSGIESLNQVLSLMQPAQPAAPATTPAASVAAPKVVDLIAAEAKPNGSTGTAADPARKEWKYEDWQAKDNAGLMKMREEDEPSYVALYENQFGFKPQL
jgi:ATP-dependent protease ClpP protease subunit